MSGAKNTTTITTAAGRKSRSNARLCDRLLRLDVEAYRGKTITIAQLGRLLELEERRPLYTIVNVAIASGAMWVTSSGHYKWADVLGFLPAGSAWPEVTIKKRKMTTALCVEGSAGNIAYRIMTELAGVTEPITPEVAAARLGVEHRRVYDALPLLVAFNLWESVPKHQPRYRPVMNASFTVPNKPAPARQRIPESNIVTRSRRRRGAQPDTEDKKRKRVDDDGGDQAEPAITFDYVPRALFQLPEVLELPELCVDVSEVVF